MAARYLKSLNTGVVLPYVQASLLSPGVREMSAEECEEYEASIGKKSAPKKKAKQKDAKPAPVVAKGTVTTKDISEGEPTADEVLKALEAD